MRAIVQPMCYRPVRLLAGAARPPRVLAAWPTATCGIAPRATPRPRALSSQHATSGARLRELVIRDDPQAWRKAGFTVAEETGSAQFGCITIRLIGHGAEGERDGTEGGAAPSGLLGQYRGPGRGIVSWTFEDCVPGSGARDWSRAAVDEAVARWDVAPGAAVPPQAEPRVLDVDGMRTVLRSSLPEAMDRDVDASGTSGGGATHANGAGPIDHVVVFTSSADRTAEAVAQATGLAPRKRKEMRGWQMVFFKAGEAVIEIVGPLADPKAEAGEAGGAGADKWAGGGGDAGAGAAQVQAFLTGITHTVPDIEATKALLRDVSGNVKDAAQPGRRILTLRHEAVGISVPTAFMTQRPARL